MKICILGGTGNMGTGLTIRWALNHEVYIGSRSREKAENMAGRLLNLAKGFYQDKLQGSITGLTNRDSIREAGVIVICLRARNGCAHEKERKTLLLYTSESGARGISGGNDTGDS